MYALEARPSTLPHFPRSLLISRVPQSQRVRSLCSITAHAFKSAPIQVSFEGRLALAPTSRRSVLFGLVSTLSFTQHSEQAIAGLIDEQQADQVFAVANQSVVAIADYKTSNSSEVSEGTGSGFIWDTYGHVVTNYHCIAKLATDKAGSQVQLHHSETLSASPCSNSASRLTWLHD